MIARMCGMRKWFPDKDGRYIRTLKPKKKKLIEWWSFQAALHLPCDSTDVPNSNLHRYCHSALRLSRNIFTRPTTSHITSRSIEKEFNTPQQQSITCIHTHRSKMYANILCTRGFSRQEDDIP